jgi:hypothetical protein
VLADKNDVGEGTADIDANPVPRHRVVPAAGCPLPSHRLRDGPLPLSARAGRGARTARSLAPLAGRGWG